MAKQTPSSFPSSDVVFLDRGNGTSVLVHLHGATVLSWKCQGQEVLFLSEKAVFDNKKAIRGGIPVVFPNFGPWDLGPQHGFARTKRWQAETPARTDSAGNVVAEFVLQDDEATRAIWDFRFKVVYTVQVMEKTVTMNVAVNNLGSKDFDFTCLLHTYFRIPDISKTAVMGLQNTKYVDKVRDGEEVTEAREEIRIDENYDRVYMDTPSEIVVGKVADGSHSIIMQTMNFPDTVVWNPWADKAKAMSDFGDDEYSNMVCVEAGYVAHRVQLNTGQQFVCSQKLTFVPATQ
ncbi:putative glucose-6-phosphate 1-epimerase [Haliotis rufescens]|uniref:putative glucose-6-phosphate 1-epimerase n=1 Tax=Haliotis rufescens TaxID=6454 RepID=UPI00201F46B3|nr:putative glucose-6-phosphate 1-epimerase [Haliotis rufescens]